ncbi:hypothetical protein RSOLAG22IIIB_14045 [Rhizoctonia solani]|uniref:Transmembrane protein n=1 Tax=Rhizoctonia solani TaxID=456999 RepID=A0A0K6FTE5_9AGAM|nr:hypothetical protein RSOLAG22IIIB_14045 [Rhizoctonia solani]
MLFVSRFVVSVGAFFATVCDFSNRPNSGDYASVSLRGPVLLKTAWVESSAVPALEVNPYSLLSRLALSRARVKRRRLSLPPERLFVKYPLTIDSSPSIPTSSTYPNLTQSANGMVFQSVTLTALPYNGSNDLAYYDDRRALIVHGYTGPRELAIYYRPSSLAVYTGLTDYVQFGVDPHHYELVTNAYRSRFVIGACLVKEYGHLDPIDFERWAVDNPTNVFLDIQRPRLLQAFSLTAPQHLTVGKLQLQPEERAAWAFAYFHILGFLFTLIAIALGEYIELRRAFRCEQSATLAPSSGSDRDMIALTALMDSPSSESEPAECSWWQTGEETRILDYSISPSPLEQIIITTSTTTGTLIPTSSTTSTNAPTSAEVLQDPNASSRPRKALSTRPSGPRFKTAAWRRCRIK